MGWRQRRALWQRRWLTRRIPPARHITLGPRSLFILPTRLGLGYLLVMIANLVMLVAYCLASLFMVAMWLTHRNLLGLSLFGGPMALGEAGQSLPIRVTVHAHRPARALLLTLNEGTLWLAQADSAPILWGCFAAGRCWICNWRPGSRPPPFMGTCSRARHRGNEKAGDRPCRPPWETLTPCGPIARENRRAGSPGNSSPRDAAF